MGNWLFSDFSEKLIIIDNQSSQIVSLLWKGNTEIVHTILPSTKRCFDKIVLDYENDRGFVNYTTYLRSEMDDFTVILGYDHADRVIGSLKLQFTHLEKNTINIEIFNLIGG